MKASLFVVWRLLLFVAATIAVAWLLITGLFPLVADTPAVAMARHWNVSFDQLGALVALLVATYVARRFGDRAHDGIWAFVGMDRRAWHWRPLLTGTLAGTLAILIPSALLLVAGRLDLERQPALMSWASSARNFLIFLAPAALVEELMIRGYVLSVLRERFGIPAAVALTSVAFGIMHLFNPGPTLLSTSMVTLAGIFLATVRLATGSLYAAWLAHFSWNFVQAALLHAPVSGLPLPTPGYRLADHGPAWLTGGAWGPEGGVAAAIGMLVATFLLVHTETPTHE